MAVLYDKPIPIKGFKQNIEDLEQYCRHNQDMEIYLKEWVPMEVVQHIKKKYGSQIICPNIGQVITEIFTNMINEAAWRRRTKTKVPNPALLNEAHNRTLMALQGFLGNDPLRMIVSDMMCLLRYYSGKKDIDL
jgi:hypothetical protein